MHKLLIILSSTLVLSACTPGINSEQISSSAGGDTTYTLTESEVEEFWANTDALIAKVGQFKNFHFQTANEIAYLNPTGEWQPPREVDGKQLINTYLFPDRKYELFVLGGEHFLDDTGKLLDPREHYEITENGKLLFSHEMCYGADGPIIDIRLVDDKPAVTFREKCPYGLNIIAGENADPKDTVVINIFYDGKTMNESYGQESSHFLFSYNNKIGFVTRLNGKEYLFYDGKIASEAYDEIITSMCCDTIRPIFKVYDNGILLFRALRGEKYLMAEVDLNAKD